MTARLIDTRSILVYTQLIAVYTAIGIGILFGALYLCYLIRHDVEFATSNALMLKIGRVAYRYSHGSIQYICGQYDPELAYILKPGECEYEDIEYRMAFHANSAGLRDDEAALQDPEIVVLGDSHALGLGVSQNETFAALVEEGSGKKVLNTGVSSYGTARELMLFRRLGVSNADYVIIQYCRNDFDENKQYAELGGRLNIMPEEEYERLREINNDRHRSFVHPGLGVIMRTIEKTKEGIASLFGPEDNGISEAAAFKYALEKNKDLLKDKKVIILELNGSNLYDNLFMDNVKQEFVDSDLDLDFIDVREFLTDEDYYVLDNHMRPSGHQKVAKAILEIIRGQ